MSDQENITAFTKKIQDSINDFSVLKAVAVPQADIASQALCTSAISRLQGMLLDVDTLAKIEERYRNATNIWIT